MNTLTAINLVEGTYGEPVRYEVALIESEHSHMHRIMVANNWHGYTLKRAPLGHIPQISWLIYNQKDIRCQLP